MSQPSFLRKNALKLALSAVITASLLYVLAKEDMSLVPGWAAFASVRWWTVPVYIVSLLAMTYFRAVRWRALVRPLGEISAWEIIKLSLIGFAAILILPFRIGEFVRPMLISRHMKVSFPAVTGSAVAERVIDGFVVSIVLALALLYVPTLDPLPETVVGLSEVKMSVVRGSGLTLLAVFSSAFATIAVYYFARDFARRATFAVFGLISKPLAQKLADTASGLADGLSFLSRRRDALPFLRDTALYWGINGLGMWFLAWGCGLAHQDGSAPIPSEGFAMMGMLSATVIIPGPPGLLGLFHIGIYCGMSMYYPAELIEGPGAAYTFLLYACQASLQLLLGGAALLDPRARRQLQAREST